MQGNATYQQIRHQLDGGKITCLEVVSHYLSNIKSKNADLNAFLTVYEEEAIERAKEIDNRLKRGKAGRLAGMIVGIKDVLCYQDHPLQCGSQILDGFNSQFNATVVQRLLDEDAIR